MPAHGLLQWDTPTLSCTDLDKGPWDFVPVGNIVWKYELEPVVP
jgi:hypothetical protein